MRRTSFTTAVAVSILAFAGNSNAFWRMECRSSVGMARLDPLVFPNEVGTHVHDVFGSSGFSQSCTYNDLRQASCTSCSVAEDKSSYWHPELYFQAADGNLSIVDKAGGMLAYYFLNHDDGESIKGFPANFKMLAGETSLRNFTLPVPDPPKSEWGNDPSQSSQSALGQKAIGFNCLDYSIAPEGSLYRHFLPDKAYTDAHCTDGIRFELMFPSCWNGKDTDSPNHKDHVAYPATVMDGPCPSSHPVRLPGLFYEVIYNTQEFIGQAGTFVLANGDPTGYGYHGDFLMGWDEGFLQSAVDTCTDLSGRIQDCPLFTIQDASVYDTCKFDIPELVKGDNIVNPGTVLPGNVKIVAGPAPALPGAPAAASPSTPVVPTLGFTPGTSISSGGNYVPGAVFVASKPTADSTTPDAAPATPTTTSSTSTPPPPPATTAPPTSSILPDQRIVSTVYSTMGNEVLELVMIEEDITVTTDVTATVSVYTTIGGYRKRDLLRHKKKHGHGQVHGYA